MNMNSYRSVTSQEDLKNWVSDIGGDFSTDKELDETVGWLVQIGRRYEDVQEEVSGCRSALYDHNYSDQFPLNWGLVFDSLNTQSENWIHEDIDVDEALVVFRRLLEEKIEENEG